MSASPQPFVDLQLLAGPMLLAYLIHWGLFGVLTVQCYIYYIAFPKDRQASKAIVAVIITLETIQVGFLTYDAYRGFGRGWGDVGELNNVGLLWFGVTLMVGIITTVTQHFYAWRIYGLTGKQRYKVPLIISLLSLVQLGLDVWNGIATHRIGQMSKIATSVDFSVAIAWLSTTTLCDVIITISMFYFLWQAKRSSLSKRTSTVLTRLIKLTIETGFLTALFTIIELVLFVVRRDTTLYTIFLSATSKMYSNTLLAVLNSRVRVVGGRVQDTDTVNSINTPFSSVRFARDERETREYSSREGASLGPNVISKDFGRGETTTKTSSHLSFA
ncbi:hypothetical protein BXZ70DRAFT_499155 [Cristinia sonorae]|uniref:DUF6534 domain-containing protein n=1 Tax=Cristinia sonorae TaxID=1940300 RepID=A0A8K0UIL6_9AGAR|nr:hypothetical protein BXZ70DRAFT_499155 [Cristinia sonorae]